MGSGWDRRSALADTRERILTHPAPPPGSGASPARSEGARPVLLNIMCIIDHREMVARGVAGRRPGAHN